MKQIIQKFWLAIAMLCLSFSASAYDFEVDGIRYDIIDLAELTCGVSGTAESLDYTKDIVLPSQVSYNGQDFTVTKILKKAFYETKIKKITLPSTCTEIGEDAFYGCSSLSQINIPDGVTSIGMYAFSDCSSLSQINIPDGVTSIGDSAFSWCSSLSQINIPDGVTSIGTDTFNGCSSLSQINIPDGVTSIGDRAFNGCSSLSQINIPDGVTSIGDSAFSWCSSLSQINIPDGVTSIGADAFNGCSSLSQINIPDGVTRIGTDAFNGCSSLSRITLPENLTSIGEEAFDNCRALKEISVKSIIPPSCIDNLCSSETYEECVLKVPVGSLDAYKTADVWENFRNIEECDFSGVEAIEGDKDLSCVADNGILRIENKDEKSIVRVYNIQGAMVAETSDDVVNNLPDGLYIVTVDNKSFKVSLR